MSLYRTIPRHQGYRHKPRLSLCRSLNRQLCVGSYTKQGLIIRYPANIAGTLLEILHFLRTSVFYADDVRKGYKGCFGDGDGPYVTSPWGGGRTLPAALNTNGLTHEQCALSAALANFEVFGMQANGYCFMGTLADVAQMKQKLDDATCNSIPCTSCNGNVNRVYSTGLSPMRCSCLLPHGHMGGSPPPPPPPTHRRHHQHT
jgi:hypothetical protein